MFMDMVVDKQLLCTVQPHEQSSDGSFQQRKLTYLNLIPIQYSQITLFSFVVQHYYYTTRTPAPDDFAWICLCQGALRLESYPDSVNSTFTLCNLHIYTIPMCGRDQKSSKSPPLNHNVPTVVETQFLYLFWVNECEPFFFFSGKV